MTAGNGLREVIKERLAAARKSAGYATRPDAAKAADVSLGSLTNWERGESGISPESLVKLADTYGVTADYLLGRTDHPRGVGPRCYVVDQAGMEILRRAKSISDVQVLLAPPDTPLVLFDLPPMAKVVDEGEFRELLDEVQGHIDRLSSGGGKNRR